MEGRDPLPVSQSIDPKYLWAIFIVSIGLMVIIAIGGLVKSVFQRVMAGPSEDISTHSGEEQRKCFGKHAKDGGTQTVCEDAGNEWNSEAKSRDASKCRNKGRKRRRDGARTPLLEPVVDGSSDSDNTGKSTLARNVSKEQGDTEPITKYRSSPSSTNTDECVNQKSGTSTDDEETIIVSDQRNEQALTELPSFERCRDHASDSATRRTNKLSMPRTTNSGLSVETPGAKKLPSMSQELETSKTDQAETASLGAAGRNRQGPVQATSIPAPKNGIEQSMCGQSKPKGRGSAYYRPGNRRQSIRSSSPCPPISAFHALGSTSGTNNGTGTGRFADPINPSDMPTPPPPYTPNPLPNHSAYRARGAVARRPPPRLRPPRRMEGKINYDKEIKKREQELEQLKLQKLRQEASQTFNKMHSIVSQFTELKVMAPPSNSRGGTEVRRQRCRQNPRSSGQPSGGSGRNPIHSGQQNVSNRGRDRYRSRGGKNGSGGNKESPKSLPIMTADGKQEKIL